jgi:hypothetical protein
MSRSDSTSNRSRGAKSGRSWSTGGGTAPMGWRFPADVLSMEEAVCGIGSRPDSTAEAATRRDENASCNSRKGNAILQAGPFLTEQAVAAPEPVSAMTGGPRRVLESGDGSPANAQRTGTRARSSIIRVFLMVFTLASFDLFHFTNYGYQNKRQILSEHSCSTTTSSHRPAQHQRSCRDTRFPSGFAQELGPRR